MIETCLLEPTTKIICRIDCSFLIFTFFFFKFKRKKKYFSKVLGWSFLGNKVHLALFFLLKLCQHLFSLVKGSRDDGSNSLQRDAAVFLR